MYSASCRCSSTPTWTNCRLTRPSWVARTTASAISTARPAAPSCTVNRTSVPGGKRASVRTAQPLTDRSVVSAAAVSVPAVSRAGSRTITRSLSRRSPFGCG